MRTDIRPGATLTLFLIGDWKVPKTRRQERFQLLRSAGFPACGFRRLSSRLFREDETRDKNVPQTRRQECLRYIKVGTALEHFHKRCS